MATTLQLLAENALTRTDLVATLFQKKALEPLPRAGQAPERQRDGLLSLNESSSLRASINDDLLKIVTGSFEAHCDHGAADCRLLEMLFALVIDHHQSKLFAAELLARFGTFGDIMVAPLSSLFAIVGVGSPIVALLKLLQRAMFSLAHAEVRDRPLINDWDKLFEYLGLTMSYEPVEQVRVLYLNARNCLIADEVIAKGTINNVMVYPREVVKRSLELDAVAVILVHNHPSGYPDPSPDDIRMTREMEAALSTVSIKLHDHVIVGKGSWFSFMQRKLLGI